MKSKDKKPAVFLSWVPAGAGQRINADTQVKIVY